VGGLAGLAADGHGVEAEGQGGGDPKGDEQGDRGVGLAAGAGQCAWSGTAPAGQGVLEEGNALAIGVLFVGRRSPVGYETFSWADQIRLAP
jgi:hypothetical protein